MYKRVFFFHGFGKNKGNSAFSDCLCKGIHLFTFFHVNPFSFDSASNSIIYIQFKTTESIENDVGVLFAIQCLGSDKLVRLDFVFDIVVT